MENGGKDMSVLFEHGNIGTMETRNRFVRSATWEGMAGPDGSVTDGLVEIYGNLARGGVGLVITGYAYVSRQGQANPGMMGIDSDAMVPGLSRIASAAHSGGAMAVAQIAHGGSQTRFDTGLPAEAPSAIEERATGCRPVEMTIGDIRRLVAGFEGAARRAKDAGFDGVELHAAHGYLLSQFLSPYSNRRKDAYGGAIENRARALFEVYEAVRGAVGRDFPVLVKLNCEDFDGAGFDSEDSTWVAKALSDMGIDAVELSGGIPAAGALAPARTEINTKEKEAYFSSYAADLKKNIKCPLLLVGGIRSFEVAEALVRDKVTDFISLARPLVSEPSLIERWRRGDMKRARCISCNKCITAAFKEGRLYCVTFGNKKT